MEDFSIKIEDLRDAKGFIRQFSDDENCPFAAAFVRQYPQYKDGIYALIEYIYNTKTGKPIAKTDRGFYVCDYNALMNDGTEFHTQILILDEKKEN